MPYSRQQFEQRVTRLDAFARRHPTLFRVQVVMLIALGLLMIPVVVLCSLVLLVLSPLTWNPSIIALLAQSFVVWVIAAGYAAWLPMRRPEGIELRREEAPGLFAGLDALARRLHASPRYHVLLDDGFGASVTQCPRFGALGWQQNYLTFGLPLLLLLSREHFLAVMAHEMTHLGRQHHRFSHWVWRAQRAWERFAGYLETRAPTRYGVNWFFFWYTSLLSPYDFVLSRQHEIEAHLGSGRLLDDQSVAEALLTLDVRVGYLGDTFLPAINALKASQSSPPRDWFTRLQEACRQPIPAAEQAALITKVLNRETDFHDPHLSLHDDLQLLGYLPRRNGDQWELPEPLQLPDPPAETAADALLGASRDALIDTFNHAWWLEQLDDWLDRHHAIRKAQQRLEAWNAGAPDDESLEQLFKRAMAVLEVSGVEEAQPLFQQVLAADPEHLACHFALGKALLRNHDDAGIAYLRQTIEHDADHALEACDIAERYFHTGGRSAEARAYDRLGWETQQRVYRAEIERHRLDWKKRFIPHDWSAEEIATLCTQLAPIDNLALAYLVQYPVSEFPKKPHYVLGVFSTTTLHVIFSRTARTLWEEVTARLDMPRDISVYAMDSYEYMQVKFTAIPGSLIYHRERGQTKGKPHADRP